METIEVNKLVLSKKEVKKLATSVSFQDNVFNELSHQKCVELQKLVC